MQAIGFRGQIVAMFLVEILDRPTEKSWEIRRRRNSFRSTKAVSLEGQGSFGDIWF